MSNYQAIFDTHPWLKVVLILAIIWELTWKLIAFWRAARNNQKGWFIAIGILNTLGIFTHRISFNKQKMYRQRW